MCWIVPQQIMSSQKLSCSWLVVPVDCESDVHIRQSSLSWSKVPPGLPTAAPGPVVQARRNARKRLNNENGKGGGSNIMIMIDRSSYSYILIIIILIIMTIII